MAFNLTMVMLPATYGMFSTHLFYFYEVEVLLPVGLLALATVLFGVWDAFNDPLVGYLSDRPNRLTRRWGRRFPWIVGLGLPTVISLVLLFTPPGDARVAPWPVFAWLLVMLLVHEFSYTAVSLTRALFPEKFRTDAQRRKNAGLGIVTYNVGLFLGLVVPMACVEKGVPGSYATGALVLLIPCVACFALGLPAIRESPAMVETALARGREPFFRNIKQAVKRKNFALLVGVGIGVQVFAACVLASIYYWVNFVLAVPAGVEADLLLMVAWFVAALAGVPLWLWVLRRVGHKRTQLVSVALIVAACLPVALARTFTSALVSLAVLGFVQGSATLVKAPIFADLVDEVTLLDGKRQEGLYQGFYVFFDRLGIILQPVIFTLVHVATGFDPGSATQTPLAQAGIVAAMVWIPGAILLGAGLAFWKWYDLTPARTREIQAALAREGL